MDTSPPPDRFLFRRRHRLTHNREFTHVYTTGKRVPRGPLVIVGTPNGLDHPRLGLSVSRKVGKAVTRNRIKRHLREAFRMLQHECPPGFDIVVVVRRHDPMTHDEYVTTLRDAWHAMARKHGSHHNGD
ncbi:MAG: ribonuclease P protein component [Planctomycetota bacterium]|jgi:ribonuclease P protein component